jgi:uncharacterized repeat protein (TIGR01451 family)
MWFFQNGTNEEECVTKRRSEPTDFDLIAFYNFTHSAQFAQTLQVASLLHGIYNRRCIFQRIERDNWAQRWAISSQFFDGKQQLSPHAAAAATQEQRLRFFTRSGVAQRREQARTPPTKGSAAMFRTWFTKRFAPTTRRRLVAAPGRSAGRSICMRLERLEDRIVPVVITPFNVRYTANVTGDIAIIANTLETATTLGNPGRTQQDVINAQNGTGPNTDNNNWVMGYVNVDTTTPGLFDSSQASLDLPAGASVLFAGLYWGGDSRSPLRSKVLFRTPTASGYTSINGTEIGNSGNLVPNPNPPGPNYEGFANVTALVQAGGNGAYTVANVQSDLDGPQPHGLYAGWSLVVAYQAPGQPPRNLTVFDGYAVQSPSDLPLDITISGFKAPPSGPVNAKVGVVAYEGDLPIINDSMLLNGTALFDNATPVNNFFNSSISNRGVRFTAKKPDYMNQMGFDAKIVQVPSGVIKNGDTSAKVTLTTSGDTYFPGVVTTSIDLFAPNLVETKSVTDITSSGGNVAPGDILEYVVNVSNTGQDAAGNIVLTEPIPANTHYVSGSLQIVSGANAGAKTDAAGDDQAEFNAAGNQVVFRLGAGATAAAGGTLAIGASTAIRFRVQVNAGVPANTIVSNQATVAYKGVTTGFSFNSTSNAAAVTVANSVADLALAKTVSNPTPNVGDQITYTVRLTNNGPGPGNGVTVTDMLPPGLQLANATASQGEYDGGTGLWTVGSLANGGFATLTIIARVLSPNPQTNTAIISHSDSIDPNPANNSASATATPQRADLSIKKTVSNATPNVGDAIVYSVTVTNKGPNNATCVAVTDLLLAGLTFVSSNAGANYNSTTGLWTIDALANGASAVLNITATVVSPDARLNIATISHADQFGPEPGNNSADALETPQKADLMLSKVVDNPTPNVGATIHYTIAVVDLGPNTATNVSVLDPLPAGLTFVSASVSQGSYNSGTGVWTVGTVDTSGPRTLTITALVTTASPVVNTATISHSDQFDPDLTNRTAKSLVNPQQADLALAKTVNNARPNVGDVITFTVTLTDNGPNTATGVTVSDPLPAGLTFVSDTASAGSYNPTTGVWNVGAVTTTTPQTLLISARVVSPDAQTNTATITSSDQLDPNPTNNTASAVETPQKADLVLSKVADNPAPNMGGTIHYTITVSDAGPDTATNVTVQDSLPAGVTFVSSSASQGSYNSGTGVWTVGTVDTSGPRTLTITAVVHDVEELINTATITRSDQFDPNPSNNTATISTLPMQADLELVKRVNNPRPNVGDVITYTVTLTDNGPNNATGVVVSDPLPAGLRFVFASPSQGTYNSATGIWTVGTVTTAAPQTLQIMATVVSPDAQTNTATITHADQFDPNPNNNSSSTTVTPQVADLMLSKTVDNPSPNIGDTIHYTIMLADLGPNAATNVTVQDILPAGAMFVSSSASEGSYDHTTNVWTVGTVATTAAQTLTITILVTGPGVLTNMASILHSDQFDPDPANNTAGTMVTTQQADLELIKRVDNPTPNVGGTVTFTLTLIDNGPNSATGVAVSDRLPAGLSFVTATASEGSYDPASGVWTVSAVTVGAPQTLQIVATVVSPATITNTAVIARANQLDPNPNNNRSSATVTPQQADLAVTKEVDNPTPNVGDIVHLTIAVNDHGPNAATNVSIQDRLSAGLAFVSDTASQGAYDPTTGVWTVGTVNTINAQTLMIAARVTSPGAFANTAAVLHSDQFDPNPNNNTARSRRNAAAGRPGGDQRRGQHQTQRRRCGHLHRHAARQRSGPGHERHGPGFAPGRADVRLRDAEPRDVQPEHGRLGSGHGRCHDPADATDQGQGGRSRRAGQHGVDQSR